MSAIARQIAYLMAIALVIGGVVYALRGPQGWPSMMENHRKVVEMEKGNEDLRKQIQDLKHETERLKTDPEEQDRSVREHTFKQKPGETTIFLPPVPKH